MSIKPNRELHSKEYLAKLFEYLPIFNTVLLMPYWRYSVVRNLGQIIGLISWA